MLGFSHAYLRRPLRAAHTARFPDASRSRSSSRIYEAVARGGSPNAASGNAHFLIWIERPPAKIDRPRDFMSHQEPSRHDAVEELSRKCQDDSKYRKCGS